MSTPSRPAPLRRPAGRLPGGPTALAAAGCLASFTAFCLAQHAADVSLIDLTVYRAEGAAALNGDDLYALRVTDAELPTTYPPFAALLFTPLTLAGPGTLRVLAVLVNLTLLVALVHLSLRLAGLPRRMPPAAAALAVSAAAVWCEPVWTTLRYGQINLLVAVLALTDLARRGEGRLAGAGIGIAAGIKLTPGLFAVHLLLCGLLLRRTGPERGALLLRQSAVAVGTFLTTVAVSAVLLPRDTLRFWTDVVLRPDRMPHTGITDNQSLRGVLARLLHTGDPSAVWLPLACLFTVAGLAAGAAVLLAGRRGTAQAWAWSVLVCACTALLVSPVSWSHHWVWCVPLAVLLWSRRREQRSPLRTAARTAVTVVFCSYALWWVPHDPEAARPPELGLNAWQMTLSALYAAVAAGLLAAAGIRAARALRSGDGQLAGSGAGLAERPAAAVQAVTKE